MTSEELKNRTKHYSLSIINLVEKLPITAASKIVAYQIAKSGTSVGANYRAVCRARSDKEFIAKMEIVLEEADETLFWLEIIKEKNWIEKATVDSVWKEGNELTAIFVSSLKTVKSKI
ncbi:four helix bundle protein [Flavobacterium sp. MFBS3-15]|uniref:four helix bundle protein n=1 Tax=Flavobacterium sp. MFBS3-15 TaxID=2989816 RepID=UPI002235433C|nr:four helix bundle protein [Flavobacterium sp. MFBS3-15]MCW4469443.1 four helix bundle protein [Flavobacterium sp. MFBS3-15]